VNGKKVWAALFFVMRNNSAVAKLYLVTNYNDEVAMLFFDWIYFIQLNPNFCTG